MTRRSGIWLAAAVVFVVVNLLGAGMAAMGGELRHAALHAALLLPGVYLVSRLSPSRFGRSDERAAASDGTLPSGELADRLTHLEHSLDAAAVEIERIGEGQRFMTRLFSENRGAGARADATRPSDG